MNLCGVTPHNASGYEQAQRYKVEAQFTPHLHGSAP